MEITGREVLEIKHALYYAENCAHGTVGHNILMLIAKFAKDKGFYLTESNDQLGDIPSGVTIVQEPKR
jgi:hypothetical protein